jgi:hypothetical protein
MSIERINDPKSVECIPGIVARAQVEDRPVSFFVTTN